MAHLMISKKIVVGFIFFIALLVLIPLVQMFTFANTTQGKIVIDQPIDAEYLKKSDAKIQLVFFGYVGCTKVCSPILQHLGELYASPQFDPYRSKVGVSFVNLMPNIPSDQIDQFAIAFHRDFQGIYLDSTTLKRLDRKLGVFFADSIVEEGEIDHSDHIYLITVDSKGDTILKNIYSTHPINRELIIRDLETLMGEQ